MFRQRHNCVLFSGHIDCVLFFVTQMWVYCELARLHSAAHIIVQSMLTRVKTMWVNCEHAQLHSAAHIIVRSSSRRTRRHCR